MGNVIRAFEMINNSYVDEEEPWKGIFTSTEFYVFPITTKININQLEY